MLKQQIDQQLIPIPPFAQQPDKPTTHVIDINYFQLENNGHALSAVSQKIIKMRKNGYTDMRIFEEGDMVVACKYCRTEQTVPQSTMKRNAGNDFVNIWTEGATDVGLAKEIQTGNR